MLMNRAKILVIDDEKGFRELAQKFLTREGYDIVSASDGEEGIEKAKSERPDLVLCDIKMPKKDGYEVLKEIRRITGKYLPIIIISAFGDFKNIEKAYEDEADFFVSKPVEMAMLSKNIETLLNLWKNKGDPR